MTQTTDTIVVRYEGEDLQRLIETLGRAVESLNQLDSTAASVNLNPLEADVNSINREVEDLSRNIDRDLNASLRSIENSSSRAEQGLAGIAGQMNTVVNLNLAETIKSIGGSFEEIGGKLSSLAGTFRELGETAVSPVNQQLAEFSATILDAAGNTATFAGTALSLAGAIAQLAAIIPSLGAITASVSAAFTTAGAAITGAFATAGTAITGAFTALTVATGGSAALAVAAIAAIVAAVAALGYAVYQFVSLIGDWYSATVELNEAFEESAAQLERNRQITSEYYSQFAALTEQAERAAAAEQALAEAQQQGNTILAQRIADQAEALGLYAQEAAALERREMFNEYQIRYAESERGRLMTQRLLLAGINEEEVLRQVALQAQAEFNRASTDQIREHLDYIRLLNGELETTTVSYGEINARITEFAAPLFAWFKNTGDQSERVPRATRRVREEIESIVPALNSLADANDRLMEGLFNPEDLELSIARQRLYREATEEQQSLLLRIWAEEDRVMQERARAEEEANAARIQSLQDHLNDQARITSDRMAREESSRAESLASFKSDIEQRFELLNGYSLAYGEMTDKQIQNTAKMTDGEAAALGTAKTTFAEVGASSVAALATAAVEGKSAADAMKKIIGQELVSRGTAAIFSGAIKAAGGNPMGVAEAAAGTAAVAAGAAMGAAGGKKSPSVPMNRDAGRTSSVSVMNNFGFVGDRRATANEVADTTRSAQRRGA